MQVKFESTKSKYFVALVVVIVPGLTGVCIWQLINERNLWVIIPFQLICWLCCAFLLSIFLKTNYEIKQNYLYYRSGPLFGKIEIDKIHEIVVGQKIIAGFKPATGSNGLILKYNRWDEIYISPKTNEQFIQAILKVNSEILITDLRK